MTSLVCIQRCHTMTSTQFVVKPEEVPGPQCIFDYFDYFWWSTKTWGIERHQRVAKPPIQPTNRALKMICNINPQMPKVKIHLRTPRGGWVPPPPWILVFPSEFFGNISHGYVFGVKESNGDNEKIPSLLYDLENQGQTPFCMTFHISGCKHDTKLILVSILTFSRSRISKMLKTNP